MLPGVGDIARFIFNHQYTVGTVQSITDMDTDRPKYIVKVGHFQMVLHDAVFFESQVEVERALDEMFEERPKIEVDSEAYVIDGNAVWKGRVNQSLWTTLGLQYLVNKTQYAGKGYRDTKTCAKISWLLDSDVFPSEEDAFDEFFERPF